MLPVKAPSPSTKTPVNGSCQWMWCRLSSSSGMVFTFSFAEVHLFLLFFLQHDDLITNIKHEARCTATFQESVSGDVGCNRGEATERLVWRCIWNTWVIRDAVSFFSVSYSVLQHPLWSVHAPVTRLRCPPHSATVHIKCIYALCVPAPLPHPSNIAFSCHISFLAKHLEQQGGEKVKSENA